MIDLDFGAVPKPNWQTKSGWAAFVAEQLREPAPMSRRDLEALSEMERIDFCQRRLDFMMNGRISLTPDVKAIRDELRIRMIANIRKRGGKFGIIVDGVPNSGKSTTVTRLAKDFEIQRRAGGNPRGTTKLIPVMYVCAPSDCSPKTLLMEFANFMGRPVRGRVTAGDLMKALAENVERCGTELIVIDEIHNLRQDRQAASDATNYLKQLSEKCPATFVYVGANVEGSGLLDGGWAAQVATRFRIMTLEPYSTTNQRDRNKWAALLEDLEANTKLVDQSPGGILEDAELLFDASNGRVGEVAGIIQLAAVEAMQAGSERLDFRRLRSSLDEERRRRSRRGLDSSRRP